MPNARYCRATRWQRQWRTVTVPRRLTKGAPSALVGHIGRVGLIAGVALAGGALVSPSASGSPAHGSTLYPLPAPPVQPEPCPPPPVAPSPPPPPLGPPTVPTTSVPLVANPPARHVSLEAVSGKGIWLSVFPRDLADLDVTSVVSSAKRYGLHTLWARTGSTTNGFYGGALLRKLVPAAHAAGISVVAWDFPTLSSPTADAKRAALDFAAGADAFSADIEAPAEGTYLSARRVRYYLSLVRHYAGDRPVVATVPRPDSYWAKAYPYAAEAPFVDAFAPMVYWACNEPGAAVRQAVDFLSRFRPVVAVGQDYNMGPEGGPPGLPTPLEIWRFVYMAKRSGAVGATLYDYESGGRAQLAALAAYPW